ncbi:kinase-like domain-containing protein [Mycena galopus ATCC 62051]|nr:kinase-like domain-containing protein [Mycena galopus ATCC 62051]
MNSRHSVKILHAHRFVRPASNQLPRLRNFKGHRTLVSTPSCREPVENASTSRQILEKRSSSATPNRGAVEEGVNVWSDWTQGGDFPLLLGDKIESHISGVEYTIERKLGCGEESSVWLASHESPDGIGYVALKVLNSFASWRNGAVKLSYELHLYAKLQRFQSQTILGSGHCMQPYESFVANSHYGEHICIAMPLCGPSILDLAQGLGATQGAQLALSPPLTKNIGRQIFLALSCLHSLNYVHTDVQASNILSDIGTQEIPDITTFLRKHPHKIYSPGIEPTPGSNIIAALSQPLPVFDSLDPERLIVYLADFGHAVPIHRTAERPEAMPTRSRAPEIILGLRWGTAVDVWGAGCLLFEVVTGMKQNIFNLDAPVGMTPIEVLFARMEELLGPFPKAFVQKGTVIRHKFFDANGRLLKPLPDISPLGSLRDRLEQAGLTGAELEGAENFFRRCLQLDPRKRPSALEMVLDPWIGVLPLVDRRPVIPS